MQVNHIDGNKLNNHADNLEYCTPGENIRHAVRLGLKKGDKGEHNSMAKLTPDEVLEIRRLYGNGNRVRDITKMYRHICRQTVGLIVNRKIWTHI